MPCRMTGSARSVNGGVLTLLAPVAARPHQPVVLRSQVGADFGAGRGRRGHAAPAILRRVSYQLGSLFTNEGQTPSADDPERTRQGSPPEPCQSSGNTTPIGNVLPTSANGTNLPTHSPLVNIKDQRCDPFPSGDMAVRFQGDVFAINADAQARSEASGRETIPTRRSSNGVMHPSDGSTTAPAVGRCPHLANARPHLS